MNLYYNSSIDCYEKTKNKLYDLYNTILVNKFVHGDIKKKILFSININRLLIHFRSSGFSCIIVRTL